MPTSRDRPPEQLSLREIADYRAELLAGYEAWMRDLMRASIGPFSADVLLICSLRPTETVYPRSCYL